MRSEIRNPKVRDSNFSEYVALEVNGEAVGLYELLRPAKLTGELQFITEAIDAALIWQAAAERGITVTDSELQQAADDFRVAHDLHTAEATERWLAERHLTFEDWELLIERDLVRAKLRDALTDAHVEQHFVENRLSFDFAAVSRLVVSDEDVARELRAQVVEDGADFHALARRYSIDTATRLAGGYSGDIRRAEMEAAVESAVFGGKPGKIVGPLKTDDGWQLIKIESLQTAVLDDSMRETIKSLLFDEWLAEQRRKAHVRIPLLEEFEEVADELDAETTPVEE
jgi:putative peptide maturation system protein